MKPSLKEQQARFATPTDADKNKVVQLLVKETTAPPPESPPNNNAPDASEAATAAKPPKDTDTDTDDETDESNKSVSIAYLATKFTAFKDENDNYYLDHQGDAVGIESQDGIDIIKTTAMNESGGKFISKGSLEMVQTVLRNMARANAARPTYRRVGKLIDEVGDTSYLLDLGDEDRRCIQTDATGWRLIDAKSLDVTFIRRKGYAELPEPIRSADAYAAWEAVQPLLEGIDKSAHLPLIAAIVEHM